MSVYGTEFLIAAATKSLVLLALTTLLAFVLRHRSAALLHGVWTLGLAACLAVPAVAWLAPGWSAPLLPRSRSAATVSPRMHSPIEPTRVALNSGTVSALPLPSSPAPSAPSIATVPFATTDNRPVAEEASGTLARLALPALPTVVVAVWIVGTTLVLLRLLGESLAVRRLVRQAQPIEGSEWSHLRHEAEERLGIHRPVAILLHPHAPGPVVAGLLRPAVLLPGDAPVWTQERRRLVLLHELAHVRRHDVATQMMATVACAVYWFNPLVWLAARRMKQLREIACDDAVLLHGGPVADYAQTLLDIAKSYRCRALGGAVAMAESPQVEGRIREILSATRSRAALSSRSARALLLAAITGLAVVGTCQLTSRQVDATEKEQTEDATTKSARTLTVTILDHNNRPLQGASIYVSDWELPGEKDFPNRNYTTDENGRTQVSLPRRLSILRMWPKKEGYVPQFIGFEEADHEQEPYIPESLEFRLQPGTELRGRIVDEQGQPIAGATVQVKVEVEETGDGLSPWLTTEDVNSPTPTTDADGHWLIKNAPAVRDKAGDDFEFKLQVTHPEFAGDTSWGGLQRKQGITTPALRSGSAVMKLESGVAVEGLVTGPDGKPIAKGLVIWDDDPYFATGENETAIAPSGRYQTKHLAPGKYPITAVAPGFAPEQKIVEVTRDLAALNFQLEPGSPIQIQVVDDRGQAVPEAYVSIRRWRGTEAVYNMKHPNVPDSGIPNHANAEGLFEWTWAPKDGVSYEISAKGFAEQKVTLVAKSEPHVIRLAPQRMAVGAVTDASTGKPLEEFSAMPVIVFQPDFYSTQKEYAKQGRDGHYELPLEGSGDPNDRYRVRFEAEGYRSLVSKESFGPNDGRATLDVALQPAKARKGQVVDASGNPVENATVVEASPSMVPHTSNGVPESNNATPLTSGAQGRFQLLATSEPALVRAYDDRGFAERLLEPDDEAVGELRLQPWASVSGQLLQNGQPVADQSIYFFPLRDPGLLEPRFQDSYGARTDTEGRFTFKRLPAIAGELKAYLGPWEDSPLTSSEAIPLQLTPGEHREVTLGNEGKTIRGRVVATGRSNDKLSKQWSLNYLVSRDAGLPYPQDATPLTFDPTGPLQAAWLQRPEFNTWRSTRHHYFVKLAEDGQLQINGVPPGEYDLVIQLYEQPAGCLVETIGEKVMPVTVAAADLDLGSVEVPCRSGPRVGASMRSVEITDAAGQVRTIRDLDGQVVLLHVWASWCTPCVQSMPSLKASIEQHSSAPLTVVGLNVDEDTAAAQALAKAQDLGWAQNYLGANSALMRQLAVSSVPAYYLIGPDGNLLGSANEWSQMELLLQKSLER